jgi:hypothetical protein
VGWGLAVWTPRTVTLDLTALELDSVTVYREASKSQQRKVLVEAATALLHDEYLTQVGASDSALAFRRWMRTGDRPAQVQLEIERLLEQTHPSGRRPYAVSRADQIRRDVALWVRVRIDNERAEAIADENDRRSRDPDFRVRTGGRRPRLPTTGRGVTEAVRRAHALLAAFGRA